ncbi:MAG: hypothetical protein ACI4HQ_05015 [Acetatifactor sp.]
MKEAKKILVICDAEEEYAQLFTNFLKKHKELPWEVHTYTSVGQLLQKEKEELELLAVAESTYCEELRILSPARLVVLNESGILRWENLLYVDKYQPAEEVLRFLLQVYAEIADSNLPRLRKSHNTVFMGIYSPVHRNLQTSFALTLARLLAEKHATLYINFEYCAGIGELLPDMQTMDLADLLYFLNAEKDKFRIRMQSICRKVGPLDYVPPMKSGQNLLTIRTSEWLELLQKIEEMGEHEYVVLDLSESIQGLHEILRLCKRVFTLKAEDRVAKSKLLQYEQLLAMEAYDDVAEKTRRLEPPHIYRMPEGMEQLTRGELAAWVNKILEEE